MINEYVVLDLEMTGLSAKTDQIIEIGAVKIKDNQVIDTMECLVNPNCKIPTRVVELTGITDEMVKSGMDKDTAMEALLDFMEGEILVGQNINFDYSFLKQWAVNHKRPLEAKACDTLKLARVLLPPEQPKKLESLCQYFGIERAREHRALDDALETWQIFEKLKVLGQELENAETYFEPKPLTYRAKKQTPATPRQVQRLKEYREKHQINDEINWENLTKSEASRIIDKYILVHGR
ncbi:MAG: 3'-5' exonuclease [Agathobacter sp.]|nr:3'-5' exonuclease [Agathobacter sp.]